MLKQGFVVLAKVERTHVKGLLQLAPWTNAATKYKITNNFKKKNAQFSGGPVCHEGTIGGK